MSQSLQYLLHTNFPDIPESAQIDVYYAFYDLVYGTIYYLVKDHQATEDIIQESFIKILQKKPDFDSEPGMKAWVKTVTRNMAINYLRKNKKHFNHYDTDQIYINLEPYAPIEASVEGMVEIKMMEEAILSYLRRMRPDCRRMIEFRWKLGLTYKEIAEQLNLCEDLVRQRLYRTREGIKEMLSNEWGYEHYAAARHGSSC